VDQTVSIHASDFFAVKTQQPSFSFGFLNFSKGLSACIGPYPAWALVNTDEIFYKLTQIEVYATVVSKEALKLISS
jgi:hypothetical protein